MEVVYPTGISAIALMIYVDQHYGLEEIDAIGLEFDPNHHEAMLEIESKDHAPGTVVEEMEKGYRLKDKVLRPSRVVVSKSPVDEEGSKDSDSSK